MKPVRKFLYTLQLKIDVDILESNIILRWLFKLSIERTRKTAALRIVPITADLWISGIRMFEENKQHLPPAE